MINYFLPPKPGETMVFMCIKCRHIFSAPKSGMGIDKLFPKSKCPNCGSKKVIPYPGIKY